MHQPSLFKSFFLGGFECSTQRRRDGHRLDVLAGTRHDQHASADYAALAQHAIHSVRDGMRWHLIETAKGRYDWQSVLPMVRAAKAQRTEVIWDLCHYGWPDDIDIFKAEFVERFAAYAGAAARLLRDEGIEAPLITPLNEISFWAWAGGSVAHFNPTVRHRGNELKRQLVRAAIAAMRAVRDVSPRARFIQVDPIIHVVSRSTRRRDRLRAEQLRLEQFTAWDMLCGYRHPELGGKPEYMDIMGVNYYPHNQWYANRQDIPRESPDYRPFHELLADAYQRYGKPLLIAETGAEDEHRVPWVRYVCEQVELALRQHIPVEGICLYPVTDYPGWENNRHCRTGLLGYANVLGQRPVFAPLAEELARQRPRLEPHPVHKALTV
ncbi:hypothetical protein B0H98_105145 [Vreelandella songnenensis]|uniref:Beta-glucosidase/6-phospho-beta-glucosidase/beta-galactosidase n=1 Tax=Vreelandella songnenensis TaxID=1176243 RepID=A0A2T0V2V1_9GAMM|nr:beta-glucosidase [Halomonas songnenensis]PRY64484.1 hypothetical protein B0H98_105145 [Halomonas songnenensis]